MRLHLRGSVQHQRIGVSPSHPACAVSSISGRKQTVNAAPHWFPSPLMPQPLHPTPRRAGVSSLTLSMFTPSRSGVALIRVVARPPVPLLGLPTSYSHQGYFQTFWRIVLSFLSSTGPAKQGRVLSVGVLVFAVAGMLRHPQSVPSFSECQYMGRCRRSTCRRPRPASPP